jgi:hypothetical protein
MGQGTETPTASAEEGDVQSASVLVGAGTTGATTTGSSGPAESERARAPRDYSCYHIEQPKAKAQCFGATAAGNRPSRP